MSRNAALDDLRKHNQTNKLRQSSFENAMINYHIVCFLTPIDAEEQLMMLMGHRGTDPWPQLLAGQRRTHKRLAARAARSLTRNYF